MQQITPIEFGKIYHIYNRGINSTDIFREEKNYPYFLNLYKKYIPQIADTYVYCLLKNHFHILVRIKEESEINYTQAKIQSGKLTNKKYNPSRQFSHLFNSYTQAFNKVYDRTGGLFERPFERILVDSEEYCKTLVFYIHYNPVHHGFIEKMEDYNWSSYLSILNNDAAFIDRNELMKWFDSLENFIEFHKYNEERKKFDDEGFEP